MISQRDSRWSGIKLGTSDKTIGSHGCLITCISEVIGKTPDYTNQRLLDVKGYSNGNLVIWSKVEEAVGAKTYRYFGYDNAKVLDAITRDGQCLAEVDAKVIGGTGSHWIVLIGSGKAKDPWTGDEQPTSRYTFLGYATITYTKPVDPITEDPCLNYKKELDEKREQISNLERQVAGLLGEKKQLYTQIENLSSELGVKTSALLVAEQSAKTAKEALQKELNDQLDFGDRWEKEQDAHNITKNILNNALWDFEEELKLPHPSEDTSSRIESIKTALASLTSSTNILNDRIKALETENKKLLVKSKKIDNLTKKDLVQLLLEKIKKELKWQK